jgi:hypothetical protein
MGTLDFSATNLMWLASAAAVVVLWLLLVASFVTRSQVFCQYLEHMTGIKLQPKTVKKLYKQRGRGGVRDLLIDLLIREDLADPDRVVTPDSKPDTSMFESSE